MLPLVTLQGRWGIFQHQLGKVTHTRRVWCSFFLFALSFLCQTSLCLVCTGQEFGDPDPAERQDERLDLILTFKKIEIKIMYRS